MYNYIIVDDDIFVRERIHSLISESSYDLSFCGEAADGIEALDLYKAKHPQIVFMDLNIPFIDGLDAAKEMLKDDPDINIIIITGYGTLGNAQEAIRAGVIDYLSKPVNSDELNKVLEKIIQKLLAQNEEAKNRLKMESLIQKSLPLLRARYLSSLLIQNPDVLDLSECNNTLNELDISTDVDKVCSSIIISSYDSNSVGEQLSMQSILEEELVNRLSDSNISCQFLYDSMQRMILIAYGKGEALCDLVEKKLSSTRDKMKYIHQIDIRASVGSDVDNFCLLSKSYNDARKALEYWSVMNNNNIVNCKTVKYINPSGLKLPSITYNEIMDLLIAEKHDAIYQVFDAYINDITYTPNSSMNIVSQKVIELIALLFSCVNDLISSPDSNSDQLSVFYKILSASSVANIKEIVYDIVEDVVELIHSQRKDNKLRVLTLAKQYIQKNYSDSKINLSQVADSVNLSANYLSHLFKKYENCSFSDYLNRIRIENAKMLLRTTSMRIYEVSDAVGYQNSKYFFQVFKEITKLRPKEYSESVATGKNQNTSI